MHSSTEAAIEVHWEEKVHRHDGLVRMTLWQLLDVVVDLEVSSFAFAVGRHRLGHLTWNGVACGPGSRTRLVEVVDRKWVQLKHHLLGLWHAAVAQRFERDQQAP